MYINTRSFWLKYFEVFCLILVCIGIIQIPPAGGGIEYRFVSNPTNLLIAIAIMITVSLIIALLWQKRNRGSHLHKWFQGIIIFYVAYYISMYGFAKILKTQFQPPQSVLETPVGDLNGFWLTWVYYGHSQTLAYILGAIQVGGSILLMFRKTRLAAVFLLLPVMVNIDLVNHFYAISPLAYFNSAHYTFILLFLLFLDYDKLKTVFSYKGTMPLNLKAGLLTIARIIVIAAAFLNIYFLKQGFEPKTKLNGEWQVISYTKNNITFSPNDCEDSIWNKIYFEWRYGGLFRYNANKFEDKDLYTDYNVNEKAHTVLVSFYSGDNITDSTLFHYQFINDSLINMYGNYKKDSVVLKLKRLK